MNFVGGVFVVWFRDFKVIAGKIRKGFRSFGFRFFVDVIEKLGDLVYLFIYLLFIGVEFCFVKEVIRSYNIFWVLLGGWG